MKGKKEMKNEMKAGNKLLIMAAMVLLFAACMGTSAFAKDTGLKNKKWVSGQGGVYVDTDKDGKVDFFQSAGTAYYKIKIPKQGYIIVDVKTSSIPGVEEYYGDFDEETEESLDIGFLNSKKTELYTYSNNYDGKSISFSQAVKKGTYYVAVSGDQKYKIRYTFKAVAKVSKSGKNLKNAVNLERGVTIKSLLFPEKEHFYKLNVPADSKITISFDSKVRGGILENLWIYFYVKKGNGYYMILDENGKTGAKVDKDGKVPFKWGGAVVWWEINGKKKDKVQMKLSAGTYYISACSLGSSGYYTMKWN